ncbi:MAG: spore germination protein [Firmicutes bacterium]|nr:spore germination protein [Bacillota bacterium]
MPVNSDLPTNLRTVREAFGASPDLVIRNFTITLNTGAMKKPLPAAVVWIDGLIDTALVDQHVLRPLMFEAGQTHSREYIKHGDILQFIRERVVTLGNLETANDLNMVIQGFLQGKVGLFVGSYPEAILGDVKEWEARKPEEPPSEITIRGPREGFVEDLRTNITLLRRKLRNPNLRIETMTLGSQTRTSVAIVYLEKIANPAVVEEVRARLGRIKIEAILADQYIEELIRDAPLSPFPTVVNSERPDATAAGLSEGQIAIIVDGSPFALRVPAGFLQFFQASEDYFVSFQTATFSRLLRFVAFASSLLLPSLYVAVTTFNPEMIPSTLLVTITAAREGIPFPTVIEVLIMELTFEFLREAGLRMPRALGQAVSIVGALVLGQAAIQAGIVSAPTVVIVAGTAIASLMFARPDIIAMSRIVRFLFLFLAATLGLFGIMAGFILLHIHIVSLRSFGVPYLSPLAPINLAELRDVLMRRPYWEKINRPKSLTRQASPGQMRNGGRRK